MFRQSVARSLNFIVYGARLSYGRGPMQAWKTRGPNRLVLWWWWRRLARRRRIEHAAADMHERYGAAAYVIARHSAGRGAGAERRFWRRVARRLRRGRPMQERWV